MELEVDEVRLARVVEYDILGQPPTRDLQAIVDLAVQITGAPFAAINVYTLTEQHQIATAGMEPSVCAREDSMCAVVLDEPTLSVVDASQDPRFADNPFVNGELGDIRFYASAPLVTADGVTVGRLCVFANTPRAMSAEERAVIDGLAQHVTDLLELRLRYNQLESSLTQLTHTRDELRRSNESLAAFASQISHDLRTPLTAVLANAELLSEEPAVLADPEVADLANEVVRSSLRMGKLIEEVLSYAQVAGRLHVTDTDLGALVASVLADSGPTLRARQATVHVELLPMVACDAGQIYVVLLNLVENAVKYAGDSPPRITIGCRRDPDFCVVRVTDQGIGIPDELLESVFQPFVRVDSASPVGGSGIGLDTARRVIESHGGRIGAESEPGDGTTIWFELPWPQEAAGFATESLDGVPASA